MKYIVIVAFLLLSSFSCSVSDDSLNKNIDDYQKAVSLYSTNIEEAEKIAELSFKKLDQTKDKDKESVVKLSYLLGLINSTKGKYTTSVDYLLISNSFSQEIGNMKYTTLGLEALGFVNNELENYFIASKYLKEALFLNFDDKEQKSRLLVSLARAYFGQGKKDSANQIVNKIIIEARNGDKSYMASMYFHAGYLNTIFENYDFAIKYSLKSSELNDSKSNLAPNYNNIAYCYFMKNDQDKALEYVNNSLIYNESYNQSHAYRTRALIHINNGKLEQAYSDIKASYKYKPDYSVIADGYSKIAQAYKQLGNKDKEAKFFELSSSALYDRSKFEKEKSEMAREVINKIFIHQNTILQASINNEAKWKNISWSSGGLIISMLIGFFYYRSRKNKKIKSSIADDFNQIQNLPDEL